MGFKLVIGFTEQLQTVTASNYNVLITAYTKFSQFVFISRFMVKDPNSVLCLSPFQLVNVS
jgi:hypothetical protein